MTKIIPFLDLWGANRRVASAARRKLGSLIRGSDFVLGEELGAFEQNFSDYLGGQAHVIGCGNGTDAIELAVRALHLQEGSEVLVPANSFIASAIGVMRAGLKVRFVDPNPRTLLVDAESLDRALTSQTRAVMVVHLFGNVAAMDGILSFAKKNGLFIIEDAAQAHGALWGGSSVGLIGDIGATSFYPGKNLGAFGDGGAVVTSSQSLAESARLLRNFGSAEKYKHDSYGFNSRLDSLQAGVLNIKLRHLEAWNDERRAIAALYDRNLAEVESISRPDRESNSVGVHHLYPVLVDNRDSVRQQLGSVGVQTLIHYPTPLPRLKFFADHVQHKADFPVADDAASRLLSLPIFPGLSKKKVRQASNSLLKILANLQS